MLQTLDAIPLSYVTPYLFQVPGDIGASPGCKWRGDIRYADIVLAMCEKGILSYFRLQGRGASDWASLNNEEITAAHAEEPRRRRCCCRLITDSRDPGRRISLSFCSAIFSCLLDFRPWLWWSQDGFSDYSLELCSDTAKFTGQRGLSLLLCFFEKEDTFCGGLKQTSLHVLLVRFGSHAHP